MPLANAKRIEQERLNLCLSKEAFAKKCDVDARTLKKIEAGIPVSYQSIATISKKLKIEPVSELIAADPACAETGDEADDLLGQWAGTIEQPHGPGKKPFSGKVVLEFCRTATGIEGSYTFAFGSAEYRCTGPVTPLGRGYYKFDAASENRRMFNTFYFLITRAGDHIEGSYVGFGPHTNDVITGTACGERVRPK